MHYIPDTPNTPKTTLMTLVDVYLCVGLMAVHLIVCLFSGYKLRAKDLQSDAYRIKLELK